MRVLFWISLALVAYAYVGYAAFLVLLARVRRKPVAAAPVRPSVTVVLAVHNEERNLERKLTYLYAMNYPAGQLEIVVTSDGSTDGTERILQEHRDRVRAIHLPSAQGKAVALNHAVAAAGGEILVFMDARQSVDPDAISALVAPFADPSVGAVSGELHLETADGRPSPDALGIYWKIEKLVRKLESSTGSVVGATGALFALRRDLYQPLPPGTLLDDVLSPMNAARSGRRVLFTDAAIARDQIFPEGKKEFGRKVRTLTGNYQLLQLAPWLLVPGQNPLLFRLISHKLLRLLVPFLLVVMLLCSAGTPSLLYRALFALQLLLYLLALLGAFRPDLRRNRAISIAYTFAMLNVAAAMAFYNFVRGQARWA
jgi:poly-beta-1,6-N-acetyl-D-glucosamine synthase